MKKLLSCLGKYKIYAILAPLFVALEVVGEVAIPYLMEIIVDDGIGDGKVPSNMSIVVNTGILMAIIAILSLIFGILSGKFAVKASTGFAAGIRTKQMEKIQSFSAANMDKFSTASLITRLTKDVTNIQIHYKNVRKSPSNDDFFNHYGFYLKF